MTIYLFIDLPFNEIGCYPTSLRDGERKKRKKTRGGEGKAGLLLKGQLISCFCFWPLSAWTQSEGNMSEPMGCMLAGALSRIYHLISPCFLHTLSSDLIIEEATSLAARSLPRPLCLTLFSIMRGPY